MLGYGIGYSNFKTLVVIGAVSRWSSKELMIILWKKYNIDLLALSRNTNAIKIISIYKMYLCNGLWLLQPIFTCMNVGHNSS